MLALIAMSLKTAHRLQELGLLVAGLGALALFVGGIFGYQRVRGDGSQSPIPERLSILLAGLLLGIGILVQLVGVHR